MTHRRIIIFLVIVLGLLVATFSLFPSSKSYVNETFGLKFDYPKDYRVEERELGGGERGHFQIFLTEDVPWRGDEGPTAITIDIYQNDLDQLSLDAWIRGTNQSNFKLAPSGTYASTTIAGLSAAEYDWDGLYRGHTVVTEWKDNLIAFSVTYLEPSDQIVGEFTRLLSSVEWR